MVPFGTICDIKCLTNTNTVSIHQLYYKQNAKLQKRTHQVIIFATAAFTSEKQWTAPPSLPPDATFVCSVCGSVVATCSAAIATVHDRNEPHLQELSSMMGRLRM